MKLRGIVFGGTAFASVLAASTGALAQIAPVGGSNCPTTVVGGGPIAGPGAGNLGQMASTTSAIVAAELSNATTAFQAQQGSAFVSAPANPPPDSPGGGIWARAVGGQVTTSSSSVTNTSNVSPLSGLNQATIVNCNNRVRDEYAGFQIGADTAKLNWNGWNIHLGTTAGYLGSDSKSLTDTFSSNVQIPFLGTYLVATYGRFFADVMVRGEYYNISLNNPAFGFFNQPISGRGVSVAVNAGYNFALQNNWFIEPSGGFTYSKTKIDSFSSVGVPGLAAAPGANISGTFAIDDVKSEIGRLSVRVGTVVQSGNLVLQPFASASVFHEFAGTINSNFTTCVNCNFFNGNPASFTANTATSRIGTYGQYSLGVAGQVANTGWLGFARVDYRNGDHVDGWAGTGGIRYQFTPEMLAAIMPTKAPVKAVPAALPVLWTGVYIGVHGGIGYGTDRIGFVGSGEDSVRTHHAGVLGGGQIGYNYQLPNNFVLGVEGEASWADLHGGRTCGAQNGLDAGGFPVGFSPFFMTCNTKLSWLGAITGKVGYLWNPRTLLYVKGGVAFTHEDVNATCIIGGEPAPGVRECRNQAGVVVNNIGTSADRVGGTVGFGTEFAFNANWSARAEYDWYGFGSRTATASDGTTVLTSKTDVQVTKIGLNYRFGPR